MTPAHAAAAFSACLAVAGVVQSFAGWLAARQVTSRKGTGTHRPPITVLKPLHGDEALLESALATFCAQDYPAIQIVFGVQRTSDPAIRVVERLRTRFPAIDMVLVVDPTPHGANRKIANLINMLPFARHDVLVISDSDMHVAPDYLARVADALARPGTGLVTSIYTGLPGRDRLSAQLGAAYINQIFASGALVGRYLGRQDCLGATMALRRDTLAEIGGLAVLSPYVADDGILGRRVRDLGLSVGLAATVPATTVAEIGMVALFRHELRWARTIRAMEPYLFVLSLLQYPAFWALLTALLAGGAPWSLLLLAGVVALRAIAGRGMEHALGAARTPLWLAPLRDSISVIVTACAYMGSEVAWRGHVLSTSADSRLQRSETVLRSARPNLVAGEG
jgi:ceramide glucosyltransferase